MAHYADRVAAEAAGVFARGWLPETIPPGAQDLREVHDLDSNERWVYFRAPEAELRQLVSTLAVSSYDAVAVSPSQPPAWTGLDWPSELKRGFWHTRRDYSLLGLFRDQPGGYCYAIEWRTGRSWGWACPDTNPPAA